MDYEGQERRRRPGEPPRGIANRRNSEDFDDFARTVEIESEQAPAVHPAVWRLMLNMGRQISKVRHDLAETVQAGEIRDFRLFGFPDEDHGGRIGELEMGMRTVASRLAWILVTFVTLLLTIIGALIAILGVSGHL